jgi:acid phosphatase
MYRLLICIIILLFFSCAKNDSKNQINPIDSVYFKDVINQANPDTSVTFIVLGDWGKEGSGLDNVSIQMGEVADYLQVKFIVTAGDNIYESGVDSIDDPYWDIYTENFNQESLDIPWYVSLGNHDHYGDPQVQVDYTDVDPRWTLPSFFYSFNEPLNFGSDSVGFVMIDSYRLLEDPQDLNQKQWIDSISGALNSRWKIMVSHHPIYSYGYHGDNPNLKILLEDLLTINSFDLFLSGHDHDMQHIRVNGSPDYFISGSGGKIRPTSIGENSLFSLSEYGFLCIRMSRHIMECYFITQDGNVVYIYHKTKA